MGEGDVNAKTARKRLFDMPRAFLEYELHKRRFVPCEIAF